MESKILSTIDSKYIHLLEEITQGSQEIFQEELVGIYLHGSMAMGCFHPEKSDIDLIFVIKDSITDEQKLSFMKNVISWNEAAPKKGLELSIVKEQVCKEFIYPTPFELHFSPMHLAWFQKDPDGYVKNMKGDDPDLAAHFTVTYQYGIVLYGADIQQVFCKVPKKDYISSIWADIEVAEEEIVRNPLYLTLNLCRVLAAVKEDLVLSKEQGGIWGIKNLPVRYHALIQSALDSYASNEAMSVNQDMAKEFAHVLLQEIQVKQHATSTAMK